MYSFMSTRPGLIRAGSSLEKTGDKLMNACARYIINVCLTVMRSFVTVGNMDTVKMDKLTWISIRISMSERRKKDYPKAMSVNDQFQ